MLALLVFNDYESNREKAIQIWLRMIFFHLTVIEVQKNIDKVGS